MFASLFEGCRFLEGDALQAGLQLEVLLSPRITDMSSQETLQPHKPEYFSSSPTELKWP